MVVLAVVMAVVKDIVVVVVAEDCVPPGEGGVFLPHYLDSHCVRYISANHISTASKGHWIIYRVSCCAFAVCCTSTTRPSNTTAGERYHNVVFLYFDNIYTPTTWSSTATTATVRKQSCCIISSVISSSSNIILSYILLSASQYGVSINILFTHKPRKIWPPQRKGPWNFMQVISLTNPSLL